MFESRWEDLKSACKSRTVFFPIFAIIRLLLIMCIILKIVALLETLELQDSAKRKGHFALYNCLVLGHTKYSGVQRVYCNPFPAKPFDGSHRMDFVMIRPPGINNGAFVVSPETVWYARVLLLFSASAATDTVSKSFDCALVSTLNLMTILITVIISIRTMKCIISHKTYYSYYTSYCLL